VTVEGVRVADIYQLIYSSRPFGFDEAMLNGILVKARRNNARDGITGALVCRHDLFLQLLEGNREAVEGVFARIRDDDRHADVTQHYGGVSAERMFPDWAMRDDPARSWMWSPAQVAGGAVARASRDELLGVFARLAAEPA
jgi:Sensors of blue-light using FAD